MSVHQTRKQNQQNLTELDIVLTVKKISGMTYFNHRVGRLLVLVIQVGHELSFPFE